MEIFYYAGMNQLVNHIDKFKEHDWIYQNSKLIIRTIIDSKRPLHPQHNYNLVNRSIQKMLSLEIIKLNNPARYLDIKSI